MSERAPDLGNHKWGLGAVFFGGLALIVSMIVIFAGPFAPQQSVGTTIGQIIGEISLSAMNTVRGEGLPPPETPPWNIDRVLAVTGPVLAVIGFIAAIVSAFQHDPGRLPTYGALLGIAAITVQVLWWMALLIAGVVLLMSIIENGASFLEF
jgi:hypothetical protein